MSRKITKKDEITELVNVVKYELSGFQVSRFCKETEYGSLDLPIFGIRFKFLPGIQLSDDSFRIIKIESEEEFDKEDLFLELVSSGYLFWLRNQAQSFNITNILSYNQRWVLILKAARARAIENHKGKFFIDYIDKLLWTPFSQLSQHVEIFDWILL